MRLMLKVTCATLLIASAGLGAAPSAFAGFDEANQNSFWTSQSNGGAAPSVQPSSPAPSARSSKVNEGYRASYALPAKRTRPEPQQPAPTIEKDPVYFNHAMGTMTAP